MPPIFRLLRFPNLLIIAFTQVLVHFFIFHSFLNTFSFGDIKFCVLVAATVCIAAAGYIINDYFDIKLDKINKPESVIISKYIKRRVAIVLHSILNAVGVFFGFYVAYRAGMIMLGFIFPIIASGLWFYSLNLKKKPLVGNLSIALMAALVPLIVYLFEVVYIKSNSSVFIYESKNYHLARYYTIGLALFAFLLTLMREIVKDVEDIKGDREMGCRTLPIVLGVNKSKIIMALITIIIFILIAIYQYYLFNTLDFELLIYTTIAIQLPLLYIIIKLYTSKYKADFHVISLLAKIIMVTGSITILFV